MSDKGVGREGVKERNEKNGGSIRIAKATNRTYQRTLGQSGGQNA